MLDFASEFFNWDLFCPATPYSARLKVAEAKFVLVPLTDLSTSLSCTQN